MSVLVAIVLGIDGVLGAIAFFVVRKKLDNLDAAAQADTAALVVANSELTATIQGQRLDIIALKKAMEAMRAQLAAVHIAFEGPPSMRRPPGGPPAGGQ